MAKKSSTVRVALARFVKGSVGALLIPPVVGLSTGLYEQLQAVPAGGRRAAYWFAWGLGGYIVTHLLLYRPKALFGLNHALLARLATWLFGGQVSTVGAEGEGGAAASKPAKGRGKKSKGKDSDDGPAPEQASTLVVISPYLVPLYLVLLCILASLATRFRHDWPLEAAIAVFLGVSLGFHIAMTGEDLQQHGDQFPIETRLMALAISILASVSVAAACLPWAFPDFSVGAVFGHAASQTHDIYASVFHALFSSSP